MDAYGPTLRSMSKEMDTDFRERMIAAALHAGIAFTPQSLGTFLGVDRRKAAVWMAGSLPRADKLFEIATKFGVNPHWLATGKGRMLAVPESPSVAENRAAYDATIKTSANTGLQVGDVEKLLLVVRTFLDTDGEGRIELSRAAEAVASQRGTARQPAVRGSKRR